MDEQTISRRHFLINAGTLATGFVTGVSIVGVTSCAPKEIVKEVPVEVIKEVVKEVPKEVVKEIVKETPKWPWHYAKLDPELVRKKGHLRCAGGGCGYGAFAAIIEALRETVGFPYTQIPTELLYYGKGGVVALGSFCGALNGASAAITLVTYAYGGLVKELSDWYTKFAFPSEQSNQYAKDRAFQVGSDKVLVTSVANSLLCKDSIANWCKESGFSSGSSERNERCYRLTGDVAAQAVTLLNNL
ncbi:MAG: C-GCAxxG-C-C family protein [Chloroflexi bacterium]|nr:C-GCAxxG-C-C family protein [Chloroflexota bacterium]